MMTTFAVGENEKMIDLIDRQRAIKALCRVRCDSGYCGVSCPDVMTIEDLPSAYQWIPVADRIPENDDSVLACYYDGEDQACAVAWHDGEKWQCWDDRIGFGFDVVAWMPLPASYDPLHGAMNPPEDDITDGKGEAK